MNRILATNFPLLGRGVTAAGSIELLAGLPTLSSSPKCLVVGGNDTLLLIILEAACGWGCVKAT